METIKNQLQTPEWWFSAIFVAIVTGVLGAYAKDWLTSALSSISSRYKIRSLRKQEEQGKRIALLLEEPVLLVIAHQRSIILMLAWMMMLAFAFSFPSGITLISADVPPRRYAIGLVAQYAMLLAPAVVQWRLFKLMAECKAARKQVEKAAEQRIAGLPPTAGQPAAKTISPTV